MSANTLYNIKDNSYYACERQEMLEFVSLESKTILEIGCGEGNFAAVLKIRNLAEVWGVELMPDSAEKAKSKIDTVLSGDIFTVIHSIPNNYFDAIICNDLLEHIYLIDELLILLKSKLKTKGQLISSIPNFRYFKNLTHILFKKDFEYEDQGIRDKTHLKFYTQKSINRLFSTNGFQVLSSKGINPSPSIRYYILRLFLPLIFGSDSKFNQIATIVTKT